MARLAGLPCRRRSELSASMATHSDSRPTAVNVRHARRCYGRWSFFGARAQKEAKRRKLASSCQLEQIAVDFRSKLAEMIGKGGRKGEEDERKELKEEAGKLEHGNA